MLLAAVIDALRHQYGDPAPPISSDPFELILWEQLAYLAHDVQRRVAFERLRAEVRLSPLAILAAS